LRLPIYTVNPEVITLIKQLFLSNYLWRFSVFPSMSMDYFLT